MGLQNYQEREWNCSMQERTDAMNHIFLICQLQESDKTSIFQTVLWSQLRGYLRGLLDRRQGRRRRSGLDSASVPLPPGCPRKPLLSSVLCSRVFCLVGFCFCLFVFLAASGESSFPNQGSNPWPLQLEAWRLNHWTAREVPRAGVWTPVYLMSKFIFFQVALLPQSEATNICSKEKTCWNSGSSKERVLLFVWKKQKEEWYFLLSFILLSFSILSLLFSRDVPVLVGPTKMAAMF